MDLYIESFHAKLNLIKQLLKSQIAETRHAGFEMASTEDR